VGWKQRDCDLISRRFEEIGSSADFPPALLASHSCIELAHGVFSPGMKQAMHKLDHSPTGSAKVKRVCGAVPLLLHISLWHCD
jgi:hypothetical protein